MDIPKLQLALDTFDLPSALGPLQKAAPFLDIIEVGTILCLAEGMGAVRAIRSLFPAKTLLADVRIVEAGGLISKMAFEAGASWVSVVSGATLSTMAVVVNEARKHDGDVQIELFDRWTAEDAQQWRSLGIRQVITHRSRDGEANGGHRWSQTDFDDIRRLTDMGFQVTVTGGVSVEDIPLFAGVPVYVFIVGRGIYKNESPDIAARSFRETIQATFGS